MEKLILDYSKWRCGGEKENRLGEGITQLLNPLGFMCCLGQFSLQLNKKLEGKDILGIGLPQDLNMEVPHLNYLFEGSDYSETLLDSRLSNKAININDDEYTTTDEKIEGLKGLFLEAGFEIEVINK